MDRIELERFENVDIDLPKGLQIGVLDNKNLSLLVNFKQETNRIDYKEKFLFNRKKYQHEFSKDISALANVGGGYLVIGVDKNHNVVGINKETERNLDPTKVSQTISKYISPPVRLFTYVGLCRENDTEFRIGLIYAPEFEKRPHFINDTYSYYDEKKKKDTITLHKGTLYVRQHAASVPINNDSWEELLERFYVKISSKRRQDLIRSKSEDLFELGREAFFKRAYGELGK